MSKKIMLMAAGIAALGLMAGMNVPAQAQTSSSSPATTITTTVSTSAGGETSTVTNSTTYSTGSTTSPTESGSGYLQMNGLVVTAVSSSSAPTEIYAASPAYPILTASGSAMATTTVPASMMCESFATDSAPVGTNVGCPIPALAPILVTTNATASSSSSSSTPVTYYSPYTLIIGPTTQLLLAGRSNATLANFTAGDIVNAYGYYDSASGIMNAEIVRDLSKPVGTNATSVSASVSAATSSAMATLQADLAQLEALVNQLQAQVTGTVSSSATAQ
ncbi:MAG TPA: hypothetical protein VMA75_00650 [Candidatus Paceibacterota bacterium]|nr:hypothetical protein [Candidatus Paceibacterota bacterium]